MKYRIRHRTTYAYSKSVELSYNEAKFTPRDWPEQRCHRCTVTIEPAPDSRRERLDYYGNTVCYFEILEPHDSMEVFVDSEVSVDPLRNLTDLFADHRCDIVRDQLLCAVDPQALDARQFILDSPLVTVGPVLREYARTSFAGDRPFRDAVCDLNQRIFEDFTFAPESTTVATPLDEVMRKRKGVCQDFAHIAVGCLRSVGFAARYVSGYIETQPPPGTERLVGADASHAWCSVFLPGTGWFDIDPTNKMIPDGRHITVAWGRDYSDVTPLKGVIYGGGKHKLSVAVDVEPL